MIKISCPSNFSSNWKRFSPRIAWDFTASSRWPAASNWSRQMVARLGSWSAVGK